MVNILSDKEIERLKKAGKVIDSVNGKSLTPMKKPKKEESPMDMMKRMTSLMEKFIDGNKVNAEAIKTIAMTVIKFANKPRPAEKIIEKTITQKEPGKKAWDMEVVRGTDGFIQNIKLRETSK